MPPAARPERVTYVGHATVLIELGGARLLTDPVLRRHLGPLRRHGPPPETGASGDLDALLISHLHRDHADPPSLRGIDPGTPAFVPPGAAGFLERLGFAAVTELAPGESAAVGEVRITAVEARHGRGRGPFSRGSEAVGFEVAATRRVYFAGDTDLFPGMESLAGGLDLALLPVWGWGPNIGSGHLDPRRAARAAALLSPRIAVPIHWGTLFPAGLARLTRWQLESPPHQFERWTEALAPQVEVRVLAPGEGTSLSP
jgi:L-ascorbate metabolism protein UlaG (beta-lactamase superfamily)